MLQRARLVQPPWATPLNGWARSSPKCTASGSRSASVPPRRPSSSKAPSLRSGGSSGVGRGSSASSVRSYQGSSSLPVDRVRPAAVEHLLRRPQLHVGVDHRAAAHAGRLKHRHVAHQAQVEHAVRVRAGVPEQARGLLGAVGEVPAPEAPPPLEDADPPAGLGQPAGHDAAPEAGADDQGVVRPLHDREPIRPAAALPCGPWAPTYEPAAVRSALAGRNCRDAPMAPPRSPSSARWTGGGSSLVKRWGIIASSMRLR